MLVGVELAALSLISACLLILELGVTDEEFSSERCSPAADAVGVGGGGDEGADRCRDCDEGTAPIATVYTAKKRHVEVRLKRRCREMRP